MGKYIELSVPRKVKKFVRKDFGLTAPGLAFAEKITLALPGPTLALGGFNFLITETNILAGFLPYIYTKGKCI